MIPRALALSLLASTSAFALDDPRPDPHIRTQAYSQFNITQVQMAVDHITNITFGKDERLKRLTYGKMNSPDDPISVPPDDKNQPFINNVPLLGRQPGSTDFLAIMLLPDGSERTYRLQIKVVPAAESDENSTYGLFYTYPREEKAAQQVVAQQNWKEKQAAKTKQTAEDRLATDVFYSVDGTRNWKYRAQGKDRGIAPTSVSDNGRLTALRFPGNMQLPTVYTVDASGDEHTASVNIKDDLIVVQQTAEHFRLRLGREVLEVYNDGFSAIGQNPGTGTGSPSVIRRVVVSGK